MNAGFPDTSFKLYSFSRQYILPRMLTNVQWMPSFHWSCNYHRYSFPSSETERTESFVISHSLNILSRWVCSKLPHLLLQMVGLHDIRSPSRTPFCFILWIAHTPLMKHPVITILNGNLPSAGLKCFHWSLQLTRRSPSGEVVWSLMIDIQFCFLAFHKLEVASQLLFCVCL